ncbi:MAG: hypothetical protein WCZ28_11095 [Burkholderiaceae bacterium]
MRRRAPHRFRAEPPGARRFAGLAATLLAMSMPGLASAIDLGDASILSRQGQRLHIAIPFGSQPGERVAATRFRVVSVEALDEAGAPPDPDRFTVSRPQRRNVVYLRSERPVDHERLRIVVSVSGLGDEATAAAYDIVIPPARYAPAQDPRSPRR